MRRNLERIIVATSGIILGAGITFSTLMYKEDYPLSSTIIEGIYFSPKGNCPEKIIDLINNAKKSIFLEIYTFTDKRIADSLVSAQKKGVEVRVIFDKKQSSIKSSLDEYLIERGMDIRYNGDLGIMHNKVLIIDSELVETGSYNYTFSADQRNDENLIILRDKKIAKKYTKIFQEIWGNSQDR